MKTTTILFSILILSFQNLISQVQQYEEVDLTENNSNHEPCIKENEYHFIENEIQANIQEFHIPNPSSKAVVTPLAWPLKAANSLKDFSYYHIAAYVDHIATTGVYNDFNCGTNSYDGHRGTDISTWPFNFYKMDNDLVQVVAAASGTIVAVHDGEFDRNCGSNQLTANYIMIQHDNGSVALYWHMKKNSVTTKTVGQTVVAGEYLGVVGSSGSASGPHLHFEVWAGNTVATRIDPYGGNCNILNNSSWWINQKPARETNIVKLSVNSTDIVLPPCPATETLNEVNSFEVPFQGVGLSAGYAKMYLFLRDEINGQTADLKILNPDGSVYSSWSYTSSSDFKVKTMGWSKKLPLEAGIYKLQATYNGETQFIEFEITTQNQNGGNGNNSNAGINTISSSLNHHVYPNPSLGKIYIEREFTENEVFELQNNLGAVIFETELSSTKSELNLSVSPGIYYYEIKQANGSFFRNKIVIN